VEQRGASDHVRKHMVERLPHCFGQVNNALRPASCHQIGRNAHHWLSRDSENAVLNGSDRFVPLPSSLTTTVSTENKSLNDGLISTSSLRLRSGP
jgi:hypothetical protein